MVCSCGSLRIVVLVMCGGVMLGCIRILCFLFILIWSVACTAGTRRFVSGWCWVAMSMVMCMLILCVCAWFIVSGWSWPVLLWGSCGG